VIYRRRVVCRKHVLITRYCWVIVGRLIYTYTCSYTNNANKQVCLVKVVSVRVFQYIALMS